MKKILIAAVIIGSSFHLMAANTIDVSEKVLHAFNKTFPNVKDIRWSESRDYYEVHFKQEQIISRVTYDREGNIVKTLRYYYGEQLPILVLERTRNKFPDHTIYGVTEEATTEETLYHIILQDDKNWILITSDIGGTITVNKKYKKA
jgi:hypothetical protein